MLAGAAEVRRGFFVFCRSKKGSLAWGADFPPMRPIPFVGIGFRSGWRGFAWLGGSHV
jgi:hypothetical protein